MEMLIKKLANAKSGEVKAVLWSFLYFFSLLTSYYILRPLRDEMGVTGGTRNLPWMFTATFIALLATAPLLAAVVAKLPRPRFIPIVYLFFVANLLLFWMLLKADWQTLYVARAFFVWIAVFSVFTVSVFWSFMSDLYSTEQSKRLFGFIAAGGSIGTLAGPFLARQLSVPLGPANLLLIAAVLLALAVFCANRLEAAAAEVRQATPGFEAASAKREKEPVGGGLFEGFLWLFKSPYLGRIAVWVFLLSLLGTFVYLKYVAAVEASSPDRAIRTQTFASVDFRKNHFQTRHWLGSSGVAGTLCTGFCGDRVPSSVHDAAGFPGDHPHSKFRHLQSCEGVLLYRGNEGRAVQGQEHHRWGGVPGRGCAQRLGLQSGYCSHDSACVCHRVGCDRRWLCAAVPVAGS
jgi:ATP/ADP translocase